MPGRASVTDLIRSKLHWLSFPERVTYKLCVLSYKCLHGTAPDYLARHLISTSTVPRRTRLRSATAGQLVVPFVPSKTIGSNRSFAYCAPVTWKQLHKLSPGLCDPTVSLATFKKHLKTFLFVIAGAVSAENHHFVPFIGTSIKFRKYVVNIIY